MIHEGGEERSELWDFPSARGSLEVPSFRLIVTETIQISRERGVHACLGLKSEGLECRAMLQPQGRVAGRLWGDVPGGSWRRLCALSAVQAGVQSAGPVRHRLHRAAVPAPVRHRQGCLWAEVLQEYYCHIPVLVSLSIWRQGGCCWALMGRCLALLWRWFGDSLWPLSDCCWGLSKVTVKCKFQLKDVFCLTSSVSFCLCRHFSSVCYYAKSSSWGSFRTSFGRQLAQQGSIAGKTLVL